MSKNYLELQSYFTFLDPVEQQKIQTKNKVMINPNKKSIYTLNTSEFQSSNEELYKSNPEF
jgi:hypothetical protein